MYLWVILVVKLQQHIRSCYNWQYWISYCRWCCNDSKDFSTILAADIATDAVTTAKDFDVLASILAAWYCRTAAVTNAKLDKAYRIFHWVVLQQQNVALIISTDRSCRTNIGTRWLKLCRYVSPKNAITITAKKQAYTALVTDFTIVFNTMLGFSDFTCSRWQYW
jgi:hypothetical protein